MTDIQQDTSGTLLPPDRKKRRQPSHQEFYRVCEFIKAADLASFGTYVQLRAAVSQALDFDVSDSTVTGALKATGRDLPAKMGSDRAQLIVLAHHLAEIYEHIDQPVPDALRAIIEGQP